MTTSADKVQLDHLREQTKRLFDYVDEFQDTLTNLISDQKVSAEKLRHLEEFVIQAKITLEDLKKGVTRSDKFMSNHAGKDAAWLTVLKIVGVLVAIITAGCTIYTLIQKG